MMTDSIEYSSRWWALAIPSDWHVNETRDNVTFLLPGNERVVVSAMKKQIGSVTQDDLRRYAKPFLDSAWIESPADWAELNGIRLEEPDQKRVKRFYVSRDALMLVVLHEHGEQDDPEAAGVESILRGMRVRS